MKNAPTHIVQEKENMENRAHKMVPTSKSITKIPVDKCKYGKWLGGYTSN